MGASCTRYYATLYTRLALREVAALRVTYSKLPDTDVAGLALVHLEDVERM